VPPTLPCTPLLPSHFTKPFQFQDFSKSCKAVVFCFGNFSPNPLFPPKLRIFSQIGPLFLCFGPSSQNTPVPVGRFFICHFFFPPRLPPPWSLASHRSFSSFSLPNIYTRTHFIEKFFPAIGIPPHVIWTPFQSTP